MGNTKERKGIFSRFYQWVKNTVNGTKALPQTPPNYEQNYEQYYQDMTGPKFKKNLEVREYEKKDTLDYAIDQYIQGMSYYEKETGRFSSYGALVRLCGIKTIPTAESITQEKYLISSLRNTEGINIREQKLGDGSNNAAFYHIIKGRVADNIPYRIYLNCNGTNTPALTAALINNMNDLPEYYFKINSQAQSANVARSEQMVFYIKDENQLSETINRIRNVRSNYPQLFTNSTNINPFLKNVDGYIGYAPNPARKTYVGLNGNSKTISQSYNTLLAEALQDSLEYSLQSMGIQSGGLEYQTNLIDRVLENDNLRQGLISHMKKYLKILSDRNPDLDIKGIEKGNKNIMAPGQSKYNEEELYR